MILTSTTWTHRSRITRGAAVSLAVVLAAASTTSADAATRTVSDPRGDGAGPNDIRRVDVDYGSGRLLVSIKIKSDSRQGGGATVYVDTRPDRRGPELMLSGGTSTLGSDWKVMRNRKNWSTTDIELLCGSDFVIKRAREVIRIKMNRECFGNPDTLNLRTGAYTERRPKAAPRRVAVAVRTNDESGSVDWARGVRTWLPSVRHN